MKAAFRSCGLLTIFLFLSCNLSFAGATDDNYTKFLNSPSLENYKRLDGHWMLEDLLVYGKALALLGVTKPGSIQNDLGNAPEERRDDHAKFLKASLFAYQFEIALGSTLNLDQLEERALARILNSTKLGDSVAIQPIRTWILGQDFEKSLALLCTLHFQNSANSSELSDLKKEVDTDDEADLRLMINYQLEIETYHRRLKSLFKDPALAKYNNQICNLESTEGDFIQKSINELLQGFEVAMAQRVPLKITDKTSVKVSFEKKPQGCKSETLISHLLPFSYNYYKLQHSHWFGINEPNCRIWGQLTQVKSGFFLELRALEPNGIQGHLSANSRDELFLRLKEVFDRPQDSSTTGAPTKSNTVRTSP